MGEIKAARMTRGKRVIEVAPVDYGRDPKTVAALSLHLGSGGSATAMLTDDERVMLIEALGGRDGYDPALADRLENNR